MKTVRNCLIFIVIAVISTGAFAEEDIREKEAERQKMNEKFDKHNIREKDDFVIDTSPEFLVKPEKETTPGDYIVAKVPPTVKLRIVPDMEPEYFTDVKSDITKAYGYPSWANWARVARSDDNRFYFVVSDHRGQGCKLNLYEYSPGRNVVHKVLDVGKLFGWTEQAYSDGKIHGHMGIMPDGTLWAATHYGPYPDSTWFANGYRGSWLLSYNIYTHEAKNWGNPLIANNLPNFSLDTRRGRLVGSSAYKQVLCWDCINKKVTFAGYPPNGWIWWRRAMLCDEATGKFWSTEGQEGYGSTESPRRYDFISFDPEFNKFECYDLKPPPNPFDNNVTHLRGWSCAPAADGYFYCSTLNGSLFKFMPEGQEGQPVVESIGVTWNKGMDVLQFVLSPNGRYVYYQPRGYPAPLLQYDVITGKKKVICWLQDYYFEKYGYWFSSVYGMEISKDGSFVVLCANGTFEGRDKTYGHPSLIVIEIPEEERRLD